MMREIKISLGGDFNYGEGSLGQFGTHDHNTGRAGAKELRKIGPDGGPAHHVAVTLIVKASDLPPDQILGEKLDLLAYRINGNQDPRFGNDKGRTLERNLFRFASDVLSHLGHQGIDVLALVRPETRRDEKTGVVYDGVHTVSSAHKERFMEPNSYEGRITLRFLSRFHDPLRNAIMNLVRSQQGQPILYGDDQTPAAWVNPPQDKKSSVFEDPVPMGRNGGGRVAVPGVVNSWRGRTRTYG